ncbi:S8 family serine peptidase [Pontibacter sp. G13]|uniref:S8 family serine peptidase n=1 Tax=Pontibacter sp. G13 TaxID=3074898 RepID=UPI00288A035B|nr:S8 family serine peptidase [Pontibacter sp. G13]WNJ16454.1 S8 family serine peptidase [Pontibacter sp. G13]
MKFHTKTTCFLLCLCWALTAQGQNFYYGMGGKAISIVPDPDRTCVHFHDAQVLSPTLRNSQAHEIHGDKAAYRHWTVSGNIRSAKLDHVARQLEVPQHEIRSLAQGYLIPGASHTMWPTHKILFKPNTSFDREEVEALIPEVIGHRFFQTPGGLQGLEIDQIDEVISISNALYESGMFEWCQPDFVVSSKASNYVPSDTFYQYQFYLNNPGYNALFYPYVVAKSGVDVKAEEGWNITLGQDFITVAVVDDGVEFHEDLEIGNTGVSRVLPGYTTTDTINGDGSPLVADDAHGMGVAGIIAASHNTIGVAGVAPNSKILPVHVYTDGTATIAEFADAISWAWQNGADVINNSWGLDECLPDGTHPAIEQAVVDAFTMGRKGKGCPVMFASGNSEIEDCISYPAGVPNSFVVGAINPFGNKPNYARFGAKLDLVSPTSQDDPASVTILDRMGNLGFNNSSITYEQHADVNYSKWFGGTSVSSATVSGTAALILSLDSTLTASDVYTILRSSATDMGDAGQDSIYGYGRLDMQAALMMVGSTLPVEWLAIAGESEAGAVKLEWKVGRELNNDRYEIQSWKNGAFETIGTVDGVGTTPLPQTYEFNDTDPIVGLNTYRVKQIDLDGSVDYSETLEVRYSASVISQIFPNPASDHFRFYVTTVDLHPVRVSISDLQGKLVERRYMDVESDWAELNYDVSHFKPGYYMVQVRTPDGRQFNQTLMIAR